MEEDAVHDTSPYLLASVQYENGHVMVPVEIKGCHVALNHQLLVVVGRQHHFFVGGGVGTEHMLHRIAQFAASAVLGSAATMFAAYGILAMQEIAGLDTERRILGHLFGVDIADVQVIIHNNKC